MTSKGSLRLRLTAFALLNLSISLLWDPFRFATPVFASSGNVLVFPQLVAGGGFISYISLVNVNNSATVTGILYVYNPDGSPRSIAVNGMPTGSQFNVTIPPGGTVLLTTPPPYQI